MENKWKNFFKHMKEKKISRRWGFLCFRSCFLFEWIFFCFDVNNFFYRLEKIYWTPCPSFGFFYQSSNNLTGNFITRRRNSLIPPFGLSVIFATTRWSIDTRKIAGRNWMTRKLRSLIKGVFRRRILRSFLWLFQTCADHFYSFQ